jgi:hypothetical protein
MITLVASALLGLYLLLPVFLFDTIAQPFIRLKRHQRTRLEELAAGFVVAGIPIAATTILSRVSWHVGHWPWTDFDSAFEMLDYEKVFAGLYSEHYFETHISQFWFAYWRVFYHQARLLTWNYIFLAVEIGAILVIVWQFGRLNQYKWFNATIGQLLLNRASEWEALFTPLVFHPKEQRRVEVDLLSTTGHLYRATVEDHFVDRDGNLRGLLLKNTSRFQSAKLEDDRKAGRAKPMPEYWKPIPGANLYVPFERMANLNLRYELPVRNVSEILQKKLADMGITNLVISVQETGTEAVTANLPSANG